MISVQCALCGRKQKIKILYKENFDIKKINEKTFSARRLPDRMHYRLVKCLRCGLIFSNPIFSKSKIYKLYKKSDFTYTEESDSLRKTYKNYLNKLLKGKELNKFILLEIGCGNGFFLEEALEMGFRDVYGIEPGASSVFKAKDNIRRNIKADVLRKNLFKRNSFDIICCFHTLDHIVDPNKFLQIAKDLLKKGGHVFFIVHNTSGLSVKLFGERSPIFDIEHIYLFDSKNLSLIFRKNGFKIIEVFNVKNTFPLYYWIRLFPFQKVFKNVFLKLILYTKIGFMPLTINAGNVGIFAKK